MQYRLRGQPWRESLLYHAENAYQTYAHQYFYFDSRHAHHLAWSLKINGSTSCDPQTGQRWSSTHKPPTVQYQMALKSLRHLCPAPHASEHSTARESSQ